MIMLYFMADSSDPLAVGLDSMPSGFSIIAGYIGGDTPHVWTRVDWGHFNGYCKLPIWTASGASGTAADGGAVAWEAVQALWTVADGDEKSMHVPIAVDLEQAVAPDWVAGFGSVCHYLGHPVWPYGSLSTILQNPACDGRWIADWDGQEQLIDNAIAVQYASGSQYDSSIVSPAGYEMLAAW
jgi:hypothetical protein